MTAARVLLGAVNHALAHGPIAPDPIQLTADTPPTHGPAPATPAVHRAPSLPWSVALTFLATLTLWLYRRRRALAVTVVVCFAVLLFETGIHSVHHGTDAHGAASCGVHSVSQHLTGTDIEVPDLAVLQLAFHHVVAASTEQLLVQHALGSTLGRTPLLYPLV